MKRKINIEEYAALLFKTMEQGILLNTKAEKFNSMVISWGSLGYTWDVPTFTVYVRESRFTKRQLDESGEFTVSFSEDGLDPDVFEICGCRSGKETDKKEEAGLTLVEPMIINTPGIKEYPVTLECKVLYSTQLQLKDIPENIREDVYPQDIDATDPANNRTPHTMYIGQIMSAYIIS